MKCLYTLVVEKEKEYAPGARSDEILRPPKNTPLVPRINPDILCTPGIALLGAQRDGKEINLHPNGTHTHALQALPPGPEALEVDVAAGAFLQMHAVAEMELDHDLADGEDGVSRGGAGVVDAVHERVQGVVLAAFDVDFQDVNVRVVVLFHQAGEGPEGRRAVVLVLLAQSDALEEGAVAVGCRDLRSPSWYREVVAPDASAGYAFEHLGFEG